MGRLPAVPLLKPTVHNLRPHGHDYPTRQPRTSAIAAGTLLTSKAALATAASTAAALAAEAMATGSYKNRRASAPANLKPLPEDKAEGSGRRSRRRSLGTLVSKKTEVEATEGEMVRKGKKGAAPPPPVKHSFEWE